MSNDDELARTATAPGSGSGPAAPPLGATLGRYRLERELGAGGMGVVHAAYDPDLERRVALKVLRSDDGGGEARQRLLREARAMARLAHANVVVVHEVGSASGRDYVAMELIDGETLADWLKQAPRSEAEIVDAFVAAGRGLAAAHAAGLVHRDFKPHNVLRRRDGHIVVTDFGLARGVELAPDLTATLPLGASSDSTPSSLSGLTATGSVLGTPAYMAPEQWSGGLVGPAADQFAFCVAMWEALTGARPFGGGTLDALKEQVRRGPAELDASKLPRRLRRPLRRGLDPDPDQRWASMDALLGALARAERSRLPLFVVGGAVVAAVAVYALGRHGGERAAAVGCEPPARDPALVWAGDPRMPKELAALFDEDLARWRADRSAACSMTPQARAAELRCLDGVLARLDAVRKAIGRDPSPPTLDDVAGQLIAPSVCTVAAPPRLPIELGPAAVQGLVLRHSHHDDPDKPYDDAAEATALRDAGPDPCARAEILLARAHNDHTAKSREAAEEAVTAAEACGDDRAHADAMLEVVAYQINGFIDAKLHKQIHQAEELVRRVSQPDLAADLDVIRARIARQAGANDEALKLVDGAIGAYGARRPAVQLDAVLIRLGVLRDRQDPNSLAQIAADIARWRPVAERAGLRDAILDLDFAAASAQWLSGDVAAHAKLEELDREWMTRHPPKDGHTISGVVVGEDGRPVAGAIVAGAVMVVADSHSIGLSFGSGQVVMRATTDADGHYVIEHIPDGAVVIAQAGVRRSLPAPIKPDQRLVVLPTGRVAGKVELGATPPTGFTVLVALSGEPGVSAMYQEIAPIKPDGSFEMLGVLRGRLRIGPVVNRGRFGQSIAMREIVVGAAPVTGLVLPIASGRQVRVLIRSTMNAPLSGAQVFVAPGHVSIKNVGELERLLKGASGLSFDTARFIVGEPPREIASKVAAGDLLATFSSAPDVDATVCGIGLSGDLSDPALTAKLERHRNEIEVRCQPLAAGDSVAIVEVPPTKRLD